MNLEDYSRVVYRYSDDISLRRTNYDKTRLVRLVSVIFAKLKYTYVLSKVYKWETERKVNLDSPFGFVFIANRPIK